MSKICVIGAGRWGENHIRTLKELGCLGGIMDLNESRLAELKEKYNTETFSNLEDAISARFDGYVVSSSAETHYAIGKKLIEAGLPLIIEKPMTMTSSEAAELVALAEEKNVNFMVAHILLFHPAINKIKELIDSGEIGELFYMYSTRIKFGVVRREENVFESFAPHDIAILNYFAGSAPESMQLHRGYFLQPDVCDNVLAYLEYPGNVKAHIQVSWLHPFKEQRVVVVGSKGMIWFDDAGDKKVRVAHKRVDLGEREEVIGDSIAGLPELIDEGTEEIPYDNTDLPLTRELKYFVEHTNKKPEYSTGRDGYELVKMLEESRK